KNRRAKDFSTSTTLILIERAKSLAFMAWAASGNGEWQPAWRAQAGNGAKRMAPLYSHHPVGYKGADMGQPVRFDLISDETAKRPPVSFPEDMARPRSPPAVPIILVVS
ncbi:MAG TPA: hypothetical protein VEP67_10770, partial [Thiobacillaceae bacterium]|nr:hypothetical protein [Thiobacillaceae bacterium]